MMKILLIAPPTSIHTARWISQFSDQEWDIHLFPSIECGRTHPQLKNLTVYHTLYNNKIGHTQNIKQKGIPIFSKDLANLGSHFLNRKYQNYRVNKLTKLIKKIKPDIIHSLEFQSGGNLALEAKKQFIGEFPKWIATNWGSDIYLFGRLDKHKKLIHEILSSCDYYSCECNRDICLAKNFGLRGKTLPVFPNTGGFNLNHLKKLQQNNPPAKRTKIMLKGYHGWAGRALVGLRSLERCKDLLKNYEIIIHSALPDETAISSTIPSPVAIAAELFTQSTGIPTRIIPPETSHSEILKLYGLSRISIGLSISDAISTSFLEAMVMGSFPIQSNTACADEWIQDRKSGILVPADDPDVIEKAIRKALTDDKLVNNAAKINWETAEQRLDYHLLKQKTIDFYQEVYKTSN